MLGPRQVGKTTSILEFIRKHFSNALYVSADDVFVPSGAWLRELWLTAQSEQKILFVDEIQKVEGWSTTLKSLYDQGLRQKSSVQCVLLGSSSLALQHGLTESLTGRFQLLRAYHWNYEESLRGYDITFAEFLQYGGYPGAYRFRNSPEWSDYVRNSIVQTVVEKDILQFRTVKSPALFCQAFELMISHPAHEISYTKLLGQLQDRGNVELIKNYIALFEGAFLLKALEKYSAKPVLRRGSSPKILPLAPCLPYLALGAPADGGEEGRIFELAVGAQLVRTGYELFYWREGKFEVDYVLKHGRNVWAIEVKSGRKRNTQGLERFQTKSPRAKPVFVTKENYERFEKDPRAFLESY